MSQRRANDTCLRRQLDAQVGVAAAAPRRRQSGQGKPDPRPPKKQGRESRGDGHPLPCRDQLVEDCQFLISFGKRRSGSCNVQSYISEVGGGESRPQVSHDKDCTKTNHSNNDDLVGELEKLLAVPSPCIDDLFDDPVVRWRIGEWISLAMNRATRGRRGRRRRRRR